METSKEKLRVNYDDFWGGQKTEPFYSVKYSTVNCKYLLFLQDPLDLYQNSIKSCQYCRLFLKNLEIIKQNQLFDGISDRIFDDLYLTE